MAIVPAKMTAVRIHPDTAEKSENRRDWALIALFGGGVVMTILVAVAIWMLRENSEYVLYLALAAHVQILMVMTALAGLLVKRSLKLSKSEISIVDHEVDPNPQDTDLIRRGDVEQEVAEVPAVNVPTGSENGSTDQPSGRSQ